MAQTPTAPEFPGSKGADHESEIAKYEAMLAQDPKSRAFALLAEAYRKSGRFEDAIRAAGGGLKHYPYYMSGRVALARAYFDIGQREQAREEFEKVISAAPDNLMAHRHLAEIYLDAGRRIEAAKSLKMVVLLDPRDERARERLNSITPEAKAPSPSPAGDLGTLLDSHRYEAAPAPPATAPAIPTLTDQEIIHQPELSAPPPPAEGIAETVPAAQAPVFGDIEVPDFVEEPLFEPEPAAGVREAGQAPVPPPPPRRERAAAPEPARPPLPEAPPRLPPAAIPAPEPPAVEASPWDEIAEEVLPGGEPPDELNTETLAEIYVQQGFYDKAQEIYQKLVIAQPRNQRLLQKVEELKSLARMARGPSWGGGAGVAVPAGGGVQPGKGAAPGREGASAGRSSRDEEALKTLRLWMDRLKTEKR